MKAWPRTRKMVKWGASGLAVVVLLLCVLSRWFYIGIGDGGGRVWSVQYGMMTVVSTGPLPKTRTLGMRTMGVMFDPLPEGVKVIANPQAFMRWWWWERMPMMVGWGVVFSAWLPVIPLGVIGAIGWWLEARARWWIGKCAKCGYDRAGLNVGAVCPECGAGAAVAS